MRIFRKLLDIIVSITKVLLMLFISGIVLLMLNELFIRNVLNKSFRGMTELAGFMFLWIAFLGVLVLYDQDKLIRLDIVYARFRGKARTVVWTIQQLAAMILGIIMIVAFCGLYPYTSTEYYSSMPWFPKVWQYVPVAIAGGFMALASLYNILNRFLPKGKEVKA